MPKFDLSQTQVLAELFQTPRENRDDSWRARFYAAVPDATLRSFDPQVSRGPDTFPYFEMAIPDPGPVTPFCITHVLDFLLDNGLGAVIFGGSDKSAGPEWVFTYGNLLSYSLYGDFEGEPAARQEGARAGKPAAGQTQALVAAPSEAYLPQRARKVIGDYMRGVYRHPDPKVALLDDPRLNPSRNLMLNLTLEQYYGDRTKLDAAMRYLSWFLPQTYALVAMPAGWSDANFVPLA
jgi:hypothetical protein